MKSPLVIVFAAVVLVTVGTLAVMNKACKSSQHASCAPLSMRHKNWVRAEFRLIRGCPSAQPHGVIDFDQIAAAMEG
jgi:hypothetical protein